MAFPKILRLAKERGATEEEIAEVYRRMRQWAEEQEKLYHEHVLEQSGAMEMLEPWYKDRKDDQGNT